MLTVEQSILVVWLPGQESNLHTVQDGLRLINSQLSYHTESRGIVLVAKHQLLRTCATHVLSEFCLVLTGSASFGVFGYKVIHHTLL